MKNKIKLFVKSLHKISSFSKNVIIGCAQFGLILYAFALILYILAPHAASYFMTVNTAAGLAETAPVIMGIGVAAGLISDLVLRKDGQEESDKKQKK